MIMCLCELFFIFELFHFRRSRSPKDRQSSRDDRNGGGDNNSKHVHGSGDRYNNAKQQFYGGGHRGWGSHHGGHGGAGFNRGGGWGFGGRGGWGFGGRGGWWNGRGGGFNSFRGGHGSAGGRGTNGGGGYDDRDGAYGPGGRGGVHGTKTDDNKKVDDANLAEEIKSSFESLKEIIAAKEDGLPKPESVKVLEDKVATLEVKLAEEVSKSLIKKNTLVQNRVLIDKNKVLMMELSEVKKSVNETCDCEGVDVPDLKEQLEEALKREGNLVEEISKLANRYDEFDGKDECARCNEYKLVTDKLKEQERKLNEENDESLQSLEETLDEKEKLLVRYNNVKLELENIKSKHEGEYCSAFDNLEKENVELKSTIEALESSGIAFDKLKIDYANLKRTLDEVQSCESVIILKSEIVALKTKLEEYEIEPAVNDILDEMDEETNSFLASLIQKKFPEVELLKLNLCIAENLKPPARHAMYKHLLSKDTPIQRNVVEEFLKKLCIDDEDQKLLVKEVKTSNETTPKGPGLSITRKTIVADPSLVGMDVGRTKLNRGCKVVNFDGEHVIATNKFGSRNTKHTEVGWGGLCPIGSCRKKFVHKVSEIAQVTVVGPVSHGKLGKDLWVCLSHWELSVENSEDDDFIETVGIKFDSAAFEKKSGLAKLARKKRTAPAAKRSILGDVNDGASGSKKGKHEEGGKPLEVDEKAKESQDMFSATDDET